MRTLSPHAVHRALRPIAALGLLPALLLTACGSGTSGGKESAAAAPAAAASTLKINTSPEQNRIRAEKAEEVAAKVPAAIRARGELVVGVTGDGIPPLTFLADDDSTVIGVESDIAQLVADVLGLRLRLERTSWENLFLAVKSGKDDVGFSNITVTEERKDIYDFATYRVDQLAFEAAADGKITKIAQPSDIAGLKVAVGSGTNQEKILLDWDERNKKAGLAPIEVQYYQRPADYYLALKSGRIDLYFGPNPTSSYHAAVSGDTRIVGTVSGGGDSLQGLIAGMTQKGNGVVGPVSEALNTVIKNGKYGAVLKRWGLSNEALPASQVNPPGLPRPTKK
ncbi:putative amino acid ABC transporter, substrate-binding protein [Sphaerisporangium krabiense]|uniref:Polar amino acid transport system substrate-binding protein n=1 Tax=Sphaerisporangium krabiense TaxID=763782 RepID=A0A7W8Z8R2_9ACTN|nr:ABC transporter substrate-binding protein [Sphaerisporangium krabiense]MBB5629360.1 polar amino acid transport system substrate-binding protein [Sphaerisporangium krabiense]GII65789.1 putative amino acid ABC transporter, substrate-binding protein [Sphaerisporangium krabiense]